MQPKTVVFHDQSGISFPDFSIVGCFNKRDSRFVQHVAMLDGNQQLPAVVRVYHMGPPLISNPSDDQFPENKRTLTPDLAVSLDLDEEQMIEIARWAERIATENGPADDRRYVVLPSVLPVRQDAESGQPMYHRFSCAGYVTEALSQANVSICSTEQLPPVELEILINLYPILRRIMKDPSEREYMGIKENPPWPILLPGYLFHGADQYLHDGTVLQPTIEMACYPISQQ